MKAPNRKGEIHTLTVQVQFQVTDFDKDDPRLTHLGELQFLDGVAVVFTSTLWISEKDLMRITQKKCASTDEFFLTDTI